MRDRGVVGSGNLHSKKLSGFIEIGTNVNNEVADIKKETLGNPLVSESQSLYSKYILTLNQNNS